MSLEILRRILAKMPEHDLIWIAQNGEEALEKAVTNPPDLILMDLVMPVMDGVEATRRIMQVKPCAILVVTTSTESNLSMVYEAMGHGALDAVNKPVMGMDENIDGATLLMEKIRTVAKLLGGDRRYAIDAEESFEESPAADDDAQPPLVLIGSSTGGPQALADIFSKLPGNFPAAVVVAQHVDVEFASGLVKWLRTHTLLTVELAQTGHAPRPSTVYIAATNDHLLIDENGRMLYSPHPEDYHYRPSVNELFFSASRNWQNPGAAVLLTGMGADGAQGLLALKNKDWRTIAQDRKSSIVYGMPKAAAQIGAAQSILPLDHIAGQLINLFPNKKAKV